MGQIQTLDELIGLLIRRRLLIGVVTVFGVVISLLYVMGRPEVFESAAVIQVQSPTVSDEASPNPASLSAQRLQTIEQRLTTRENMLAVIARHGLYAGLPLTDDEKVYLLRLAVRFQSVASAAAPAFGAPPMVSALIIFAKADTREKAARVANDFAQSVLDAGVEGQTGKAREAASFFREEEQRLSAEIQALDAEIAAYKNANLDALPAQRDLRRDEIVGLEVELRAIDQTLVRLLNERDVIGAKPNQRETDRRQIDTLTGQVESLTAQKSALTAQRALVEAALLRTPEVEQVLVGYDRRLDRLQSQFQVLTRRVAEADTAQKLEERQQGETFTMLERAVAPENPISGGRRKLAAVGGLASLIAGIGLAFMLDLLNPVLRTVAQMERQLDLRPIVTIPDVPVAKNRRVAPFLVRLARNGASPAEGARAVHLPPQGLPRYALIAGGVVLFVVVMAVAATA